MLRVERQAMSKSSESIFIEARINLTNQRTTNEARDGRKECHAAAGLSC